MEAICFGIILLSFLPFGRAIFDIVEKWKEKKRGIKLISVLAWFFLSLFMVRFAEVLYLNFVADPETLPQGISGVVAAVSQGGIHALQSFSMDESYGEMLSAGLTVVQDFLPGQVPVFIFTLYFAIQNIVAPLAGGAILLDILTGVSADLQIEWRQRKEKHIFSSATPQTVALAESIPNMNKGKVAIFTDFTIDSDDEEESVLQERMESNDFIFTEDHMTALKVRAAKAPLYFYLMDEDEESNINQLLELWNLRKALLKGCTEKDSPYVTVYFFVESEKPLRLLSSLIQRCADDSRFEIKIVDARLNLIANLAAKEQIESRVNELLTAHSAKYSNVVFISDDTSFASQIVSTFLLYCEDREEGVVLPNITLVSTDDPKNIERQFESDALLLPKERRHAIKPDNILTWDGTNAGLNELVTSTSALTACSFIVIAGDSDLQNMQQAVVIDDAYTENGVIESKKPAIACFIRNDAIADQFKEIFGSNVVPFGTDSEMSSYEIACKSY